jgi:hypothetical protein
MEIQLSVKEAICHPEREPNILSKSEKWDRLDMARDTEG